MENIKKQYHKELQNLEIGLDEIITVQRPPYRIGLNKKIKISKKNQ